MNDVGLFAGVILLLLSIYYIYDKNYCACVMCHLKHAKKRK